MGADRVYTSDMTTTQKFKRNPYGRGYVSTNGRWLIHPEGTATYWYAVELGDDTYPIEETKSYWRSYQQCKNYVNQQEGK